MEYHKIDKSNRYKSAAVWWKLKHTLKAPIFFSSCQINEFMQTVPTNIKKGMFVY